MRNGPYILVIAPDEYPGKKYRNKYIYEHHLVWWKNAGITIPEKYVVHHINHNPHDNRFSNLELISKSTHNIIHNFDDSKRALLICEYCKKPFARSKSNTNNKISTGQKNFYCCRSHQVRDQKRNRIGFCNGKDAVDLNCAHCGIVFQSTVTAVKRKKKIGQTKFYCSRSHFIINFKNKSQLNPRSAVRTRH